MRLRPPGTRCFGPLFRAMTVGCVLAAGSGWSQAGQAVVPGDHAVSLAPGETRGFTVAVPVGSAETLTVLQRVGAVAVDLSPSDARTNAAGLGARIVVTLLGSDRSPGVSLRNLSATKAAEVTLHADEVHAASAAETQAAEAEAALARAEAIRVSRQSAAYPEAARGYDRAVALRRQLDDHVGLARALAWKALFLLINQSDAPGAEPAAAEALTYLPELAPVEAANCRKIAGYVAVQSAQYDRGRENYLAAIGLFEATHDLYNQEVVLDNLSRVDRLQGRTDAALSDAERAEALASQIGDVTRQMKIKAEIGAIDLSASRLEAAYMAYQSALALLKKAPDATTEGYVWSDLGVLYTLLHQPVEARNALDEAMAIWKRAPNPSGELNTLDDFGELWTGSGNLPRARSFYDRGLALARASSLVRPEIFLLRGRGAAYLLENNLPKAQQDLNDALALSLKVDEGDGLAEIYCLIGDLHARRHEGAEAERSYGKCNETAEIAHDTYSGIRAQGSLARLAFERGEVDSAVGLSERALAGIESTRTSIPEQDLRTSFFSSMRSYYDLAIAVLERMDELHPHEEYQWLAFLTAERARARMLLDEVRAHQEELPQSSAALLAEYNGVEAALRHAEKQLAERPKNAAGRELRETMTRLTVEDHALAGEIANARQTDGADGRWQTGALTLAGLQADLAGPHRVLVEYWTGQRASFVWTITAKGIRGARLPAEEKLKPRTDAFLKQVLAAGATDSSVPAEERAAVLRSGEAEAKRQGEALRLVLFPAGVLPAGTESVLIVADGPVLSVPFAALLGAEPRCRRCTVLMEPSTTFLHDLLARPVASPAAARIAVFTEAWAGRAAGAGGSRGGAKREVQAPELPFAAHEAQAIQAIFGADKVRILSGAQASPEAIKAFDWGSYTIGHFATHATLNRQNLQLTGMLLPAAGGHRSQEESTLWYGDICRVHAPLELVVLSACDTANGESIPGEGLTGLTQAFFTAGSQRVLGSLWPVDDEATSLLMRFFYTAIEATGSPAAALGTAQRRMATSDRWRAPYYWAGFSLAGDWRDLPRPAAGIQTAP